MKTRRILSLILALIMIVCLTACGGSSAENASSPESAPAQQEESTPIEDGTVQPEEPISDSGNPVELSFPKSIIRGTEEDYDPDDNNSGAVNEAYAAYYKEGSAFEGVKAIVAAGSCFINDIPIPATEEEFDELYPDGYTVNGSPWLSRGDGVWLVDAGFYSNAMDVPYEEAVVEMIRSRINNGLETLLYDDDGDGYADRIETMVYLSAGATEITKNDDGTYTIDIGSYNDTIDYPVKYDNLMDKMVEDNFDSTPLQNIAPEYFDESIQPGDATVYYMDADGNWHFERAQEVHGVFNDGADHQSYFMDGVEYVDAMGGISVTYSPANRSGGYSNFMKFFGFNDDDRYQVSMWLVPMSEYATSNTKPLGFTNNENAKVFLELAIERAQEELDSTVPSEDGSDVPAGMKWIREDLYTELSNAVQMARDTLAVEDRPIFLDYQTYLLFLTLNGTGGDISAKFTGFDFEGFENFASEYYAVKVIENEPDLKISDPRFGEYFEGGNAADGLRAIVDAGEVYVNNYQLAAEPATFDVNGRHAVYESADGWAWTAHELYVGVSDTYADAAYNFTDNLSGLSGQSVQLLAKTGTDTVAQIRTMVVEIGLAAQLGGNYAVVYYADENGNVFLDGNGEEITFDSENGSSSVTNHNSGAINEGDIVVFWKDAKTTGATSKWMGARAAYVRGTISGTPEEPFWTEEGASEAIPLEEAITGTSHLPDANKLAAFMDEDGVVTMWYLPSDSEITTVVVNLGMSGKTIGFTYDEPVSGGDSGSGEMGSGEASGEASAE